MSETILYGAFGRHNFGDMLFPYILKSLLQSNKIFRKRIFDKINLDKFTKIIRHECIYYSFNI